MKNKGLTITLIVVLSVIALGLLSFMLFAVFKAPSFPVFHCGGNSVSSKVALEEIYSGGYDSVNISSTAGEVFVKAGDDENIKVTVYSDDEVEVNTEDGSLDIAVDNRHNSFFNWIASKTVVYLPSDFDDKLEISNKFGDVSIESFSKADIDVCSDCGDIDAGDSRNINVEQKCGDVDIGQAENVSVTNSLGDISVQKVLNKMVLQEDCGDISVASLELKEDSSAINKLGKIEIGSTNEIYIDAKVSLGDVKVNNNYRSSKVTLSLNNDCGDITVSN